MFALLLRGAPARAQDLTSDVYADAKDIITELIERDLAENLSADMACYSPRGLLKYFPNTLQAVYERNFGAIKDQLRDETGGFAANYAFECLRQGRTIPLEQFLPISNFDPRGTGDGCKERLLAAGGPGNYQAFLAREAARKKEVYYPLDRCASPEEPGATATERERKQAKLLKSLCPYLTALAPRGNRPKDTDAAVLETAISVAFEGQFNFVTKREGDSAAAAKERAPGAQAAAQKLRDVRERIVGELGKRATGTALPPESLLAGYSAAGLKSDFEELERWVVDLRARNQAPDFKLLFSWKPNPSVNLGALLMLLHQSKPVFRINDQDAPAIAAAAAAPGFASLASQPGDSPGVVAARALLVSAGISVRGVVRVELHEAGVHFKHDVNATAEPSFVGAGLARLADIQQMYARTAELQRMTSAAGADGPVDPALVKLIVHATIGLVQFVDETARGLRGLPRMADGSIDVVGVLNAVLTGERRNGLCAVDAPKPGAAQSPEDVSALDLSLCGILQQAVATADPHDILRPILSAAINRDLRRLAIAATDAAFSKHSIENICCDKPDSCFRAAELYGRLAKSIVSYVLMPRGDEDQSIAARAAFKSAAIDVLREVGRRGGVERPFPLRVAFPTFSLRASWSSSYQVSDPDSRSVRFVPTVDWPSIRVQLTGAGATPYVGVTLSAFDLLAPLTEVVSRDAAKARQTEDSDSLLVLATLFHPRISLQVAMPALTKNTALVLSGGMRGAGVFRDETDHAFYAPIWGHRGLSAGELAWPLVEVSAGLQYVP